jgi:hypothetical protein
MCEAPEVHERDSLSKLINTLHQDFLLVNLSACSIARNLAATQEAFELPEAVIASTMGR